MLADDCQRDIARLLRHADFLCQVHLGRLGHQARPQSVNRNRPAAAQIRQRPTCSCHVLNCLPGGIDLVCSSRLTSAYIKDSQRKKTARRNSSFPLGAVLHSPARESFRRQQCRSGAIAWERYPTKRCSCHRQEAWCSSFQKQTRAPGKAGIRPGKNYSIRGENSTRRRFATVTSWYAAEGQSILSQSLGGTS
jgi:hypothetical protein